MDKIELKAKFKSFKNRKIAVVYTYRDEKAKGFEHYDFWKMDVVTVWLNAIEKIGAVPYILDVKTFCEKSLINTLPKIDFVINLNAGNVSISTLGLVPSVCSFINVPCLPCSTPQAVTGEHKHYTNLIAKAMDLKIPKYLPLSSPKLLIKRPVALGSSKGVKTGSFYQIDENEIVQEFIQGFDLTIPIMYNPLKEQLEVLPAILYTANETDLYWYHGEKSKEERSSYQKHITSIDNRAKEKLLKFANAFDIKTYCRIDARVYSTDEKELRKFISESISLEKIYFLELNTMPTIKYEINFLQSLKYAIKNDLIQLYSLYKETVKDADKVDFLLTCSLLGLSKPTIKNSGV